MKRTPTLVLATTAVAMMAAVTGCTAATDSASTGTTATPAAVAAEDANPFENPKLTDSSPIEVAAVGAMSKKFDLAAGLVEAERIIAEAKAEGAEFVAFPELWLPGFTNSDGLEFANPPEDFQVYVDNSIEVGDEAYDKIVALADEYDVFLSMGFSEKVPETKQLFMANVMVDPDGEVIGDHRKIRPSGGERAFFSDEPTTAEAFQVVNTSIGRLGMLSCAENWRAHMTFNMMAQGENIHVNAWGGTDEEAAWWSPARVGMNSAEYYARSSGAWTLFAASGHAAIYNPLGEVVAEVSHEEGDYAITTIDRAEYYEEKPWTVDTFGYNYDGLKLIENSFPYAHDATEPSEELNVVDYTTID